MASKSELFGRIETVNSKLDKICGRYELILKESASLIRELEEFESFYLKDSVGRELGLSYTLKFRDMKQSAGNIYASCRRFATFVSKLPLAFDTLKNLADTIKSQS